MRYLTKNLRQLFATHFFISVLLLICQIISVFGLVLSVGILGEYRINQEATQATHMKTITIEFTSIVEYTDSGEASVETHRKDVGKLPIEMSFTFVAEHDAETSAKMYAELFGDAAPSDMAETGPGRVMRVPPYNHFYKTIGQIGQIKSFLDTLTPRERARLTRISGRLHTSMFDDSFRRIGEYPMLYDFAITYDPALGDFVCDPEFWDEPKRFDVGRPWTPEEYLEGGTVIMHSGFAYTHKISVGNSIDIFGVPHEVVGTYKFEVDGTPVSITTDYLIHVPLNSLPDEAPLHDLCLEFDSIPTRAEYDAIYDKVDAAFGFRETLDIPHELYEPFSATFEPFELEEMCSVAAVVLASLVAALLAALSLAMLLHYLPKERRKVLYLLYSGNTKGQTRRLFVAKTIPLSVPLYTLCVFMYALCVLIFHTVLLPRLDLVYPYIGAVYTLKSALIMAAVYLGTVFVILNLMIAVYIRKASVAEVTL